MKSFSTKAYAKLNLALKVLGVDGGYHMLDSLVTTVDLYDKITVTARKDDKILLTFYGKYAPVNYIQEKTNAYKATKLFMDTFGVGGVNVDIICNIPVGSGLGSSSADIAGVLLAMKGLFKINADVKPLADSLGSDSGYLLSGGYARLNGRGDKVETLDIDEKLYFILLTSRVGVNTKECFKLYDELGSNENVDVQGSIDGLKSGNFELFYKSLGNDLYPTSKELNEEIEENLNILKSLSPSAALMTGSGSGVFAVYDSYEMASWAYSKLKRKLGDRLYALESYNPRHLSLIEKLFNIEK